MFLYVNEKFGQAHGASQSAIDVLWSLLANRKRVVVYSKSKKLPSSLPDTALRAPTWTYPTKKVPPCPWKPWWMWNQSYRDRIREWWEPYSRVRNLERGLRRARAVLVNSTTSHSFYQEVAPRTRGKSVLIVRESPRHFGDEHRIRDLDWGINVLSQYDGYIFVSSNCRDEWREMGVVGSKPAYYVPNCCREDLAESLMQESKAEIRSRLGLPQDRFLAVCVASLQHRKGQDLLLQALPDVVKTVPDLLLCCVGPCVSEWGTSLIKTAQLGEQRDHLMFAGMQTNALDYIYAADALVLPARAEALPRVVLEAMALKTSVLATRVDGIPELVEDEKTGLLVPPEDVEGLGKGLIRLASDEPLRQFLAMAGHKRYWESFSRANQVQRLGTVLKDLER